MSTPLGRRVRVAYVVPPSPVFAGIERVVHELAAGLASHPFNEFDVDVLYCDRYDEVVQSSPPYRARFLDVRSLRHLPRALRRAALKDRYDVLVCAQVEASVLAWFATRGLGVRSFVTHLHGNPRIEFDDGTRRTRALFRLFERVVAPRIQAAFCVSESLARYARSEWITGTPVRYAPNPVRMLDPREPRPLRPIQRFINVGRLSHQKGQDDLLRAFALARPDALGIELVLVGSGEKEGELRRLAADLGVTDRVRFAGYRSDPSKEMVEADCFVLGSRWEGQAVVLLEALQLGLPIIATDCDFGPADLVEDSDVGTLVPVGDVGAMGAALATAAGTVDAAGAAARRRALAARFEPMTVVEEHRRLLLEVHAGASQGDLRRPTAE